ncbi:hypothetical protein RCSPARTAN_23 [Rhodobacter phage RcSpartan]|uniref:Bacteriophage phiJL001 Gp84 C-terminal domain-containing protein n=1 Tax=Rhodobacter phage RcSpartan TaxID=1662331 RepID=A0A0K1LL15_9CAUD|nr:tail assembly protein [Rhodobacter phage RcSpartan]AKU43206.1 hypothetical protein RCSPARTAN_23 [Rhodobacter phage RcSpartan]QXN71392.1 minor tail protein [Rhodobacter phage RcHartney]
MTATKELYRFVEGDSAFIYTVTSADVQAVYSGETYEPVAIGRDEVESKGEMARDNIKVSLSLQNPVARKWFLSSLDFPLTLTIFSQTDDETETEWKGRLASVSPKKSVIEFTFESVFTSMRRMGLRQRYQITCPHALYGRGCNLEKNDFDTTGSVTNVTNAVVTVPAAAGFADGYFSSGIFEDNAGNLRFILSHVGSQLTLIRPMNDLINYANANGYPIACRIFPGCDRTTTTCKNRFDNLNNYGGFPFIPGKNPFGGSSIV